MSPSERLKEALAGPSLILVLPEDRARWGRVGQVFGEWIEAMGTGDRARLGRLSWAMLPWVVVCERLGLSGPAPDMVLVAGEVHLLRVPWPKTPALEVGSFDSSEQRLDRQSLARIAGNAAAIDGVLWPLISGPGFGDSGIDVLGASWATATGCGTEIDGRVEQNRMDCGMGYVPEGSRRFLAAVDTLET